MKITGNIYADLAIIYATAMCLLSIFFVGFKSAKPDEYLKKMFIWLLFPILALYAIPYCAYKKHSYKNWVANMLDYYGNQEGEITKKVKLAKETAIRWHDEVNHNYGKYPYSYHLNQVYEVAKGHIDLIPEERHENILCACWLHDTVEDTRRTYNDVKKIFGKEVAELVFALSNEKGKTRAERANEKYYQGLNANPDAKFVKLCDRITNIIHSEETGTDMYQKYQKEHKEFKTKLYVTNEFEEMWKHMDDIFQL